jgi:hypothetical protein
LALLSDQLYRGRSFGTVESPRSEAPLVAQALRRTYGRL